MIRVLSQISLILFFVASTSCANENLKECLLPEELCRIQAKVEAVDTDLNVLYQKILKKISSGELSRETHVESSSLRKSLISAQKAWLLFKEKNCESLYILNSGGAQRNNARGECEIHMIEERIKALKSNW